MSKLNEYVEKYRKIHEREEQPIFVDKVPLYEVKEFGVYGDGWTLVRRASPFITEYQVKKQRKITVLDYGCGQAHYYMNGLVNATRGLEKTLGESSFKEYMVQRTELWDRYDPAVAKFASKPQDKQYDVVACCDVMEHIPEECVSEVLNDVFSFCKEDGLVVLTITGTPAALYFKDEKGEIGENLHCTQYLGEWWLEKAKASANNRAFAIFYIGKMEDVGRGIITNTTIYTHNSKYYDFDKQFYESYFQRVAKDGLKNIISI